MPLFQQSVLRKYISDIDKEKLSAAWKIYQAHFGNATTQAHIRQVKEEQYQEGFLRDLFVNVLGYTLNPQPGFNLTTEYKNEKDSKKADGAILSPFEAGKDDVRLVRAVIELKGTDTTDLSKIEPQAFGYMSNQKGCTYVITSNFEKLRFYIQDATEHIEFNLFTLTRESFNLLYICLQADSLLAGVPLQIKQQSVTQEDAITKKLYADYSSFKQALYQNLVSLNPQYDKISLFKKTQKLLDRFLFILFAEDRLLLPPNFIVKIVDEQKLLQKMRMQQSLYERFKVYFTDLLTGNKDEDIFAYNGGLFEADEILDAVLISDDVLQQGVLKLSNYDYNTEVDVNILGHIFEHSLNEIEKIEQETAHPGLPDGKETLSQPLPVEGPAKNTTSSKSEERTAGGLPTAKVGMGPGRRKKEGVFYTPRYITKYIVENTVGTLCTEKKTALQIIEEDYAPAVKKTKASEAQRKALVQKLDDYRAWLLSLTICDPACGSGAFLNAALEALITEHNYVDELTNKLMGSGTLEFKWTPNDILENNLFGVDINEEAVEIARLSLWLRTAQKGRKLSNLSSNIKAGNSLIDDVAVAGDKAFNWKAEFKEVFQKGGFDVVIGNPPYVRQEMLGKKLKDSLTLTFKNVGNGTSDLYVYFYERGLSVLKKAGLLGYISPNKFMKAGYGKNLRRYLSGFQIKEIIDFGELPVFQDASTFPAIFILQKQNSFEQTIVIKIKDLNFSDLALHVKANALYKDKTVFEKSEWQFSADNESGIFSKLSLLKTLDNYIEGDIKYGLKTGYNQAFIIDEVTRKELISKQPACAEIIKDFVVGDDIRNYKIDFKKRYIILAKIGIDIERYSVVMDYLKQFQNQLETRYDKGNFWWELRACSYYDDFETPKIIFPIIAKESRFTLDEEGFFCNDKAFIIPRNDKFLLTLLNSKLIWFYLKKTCSVLGDEDKGGRLELRSIYVKTIPICDLNDQQPFIAKADIMLSKNKELHTLKQSLIQFLQAKHEGIAISKKLADWPSLSFNYFLKELEKQKIKLSLSEQAEWLPYFEEEKRKALQLQTLINQTDKEIDSMVYRLYGLTEEEIKIVEGA